MSSLTIIGYLDADGPPERQISDDITWAVSFYLSRGRRIGRPRYEEMRAGDLVTIFADESRKTILWEGTIDLVETDPKEMERVGASPSLSTVQKDFPLDKWWELFYDARPATLVRKFD